MNHRRRPPTVITADQMLMNPLDYHRNVPTPGSARRRQARGTILRLNLGLFLLGCGVVSVLLTGLTIISGWLLRVDPPPTAKAKQGEFVRQCVLAGTCMFTPLSLTVGTYLLTTAKPTRKRN